jgi:Domain of unknown function (DUF4159)
LRTLLVVIALISVALEAFLLLRRAKPNYPTLGPEMGRLRVGRLKFEGEWNAEPMAFTNLGTAPNQLSVLAHIREVPLRLTDPNIMYYPLLHLHGRGNASFSEPDLEALRQHLDPGGGTLFVDAACGDAAFDAAFRSLAARLLPQNPIGAIPANDEIFTSKVGFDLSDSHLTRAAGGGRGVPQLEGVKINGHWAIIYSKYGVTCAFQANHGGACKGYLRADASRIAVNTLIYSTLP